MKVEACKKLLVSGKDCAVKVCQKTANAVGGLFKSSPGTSFFDKALKKALNAGKDVKGSERFMTVLRRITNPKPISEKEIKALLSNLSLPEKIKLQGIIQKFNGTIADTARKVTERFPMEGDKIGSKMMDITLNASEFVSHLF